MSFSDIVGHNHNIQVLQRAARRDRLHHAYIFSGPDGVGKKLVACHLAMTVNCTEGCDGDSCGKCLSCRKIEEGIHPDVKIVGPDGQSIKIEQIRELQHDLQYRPFEGKKRVFIIDEADKMGIAAANALLKTLEEPPRGSILLLITSNIHQLLPTVISRCQRLNFSSLPISDVKSLLEKKKGYGPGAAHIIASVSEGSLGNAMSGDEETILAKRGKALEIVSVLREKAPGGIVRKAEELAKDEELDMVLKALKVFYRDMAVLKGGKDELINMDLTAAVSESVNGRDMEAILRDFELVCDAEDRIRRNVNKQLTLEVMMLGLS